MGLFKNGTQNNNVNNNLPPTQHSGKVWVFWLLLVTFPIGGIIYLWTALDKRWSGLLKTALTTLSLILFFLWIGIIGGNQQSNNIQQPATSEYQAVNNQTEAPTEAQSENMSSTSIATTAPTVAPTSSPTEVPTEATTEVLTKAPTEAQTKAPTKAPVIENTIATKAPTQTAKKYVLNTSTHKIHSTKCSEVKKIKSENYQEYSGDITTLINQGYTSCQRCNAS